MHHGCLLNETLPSYPPSGLENEYDRLLAEHDELKRQMARAGLSAGPFDKKDA